MAIQSNPYPLRIDQEVMDKIKVIAKKNGRSVNKEIEFSLKTIIEDHENLHGTIQISNN